MRPAILVVATFLVVALGSSVAHAGIVISFIEPSGLAGEAEFDLVNPTTLRIRLRNTSTDVPDDFDNSDQLLTSLAFNLPGTVAITGGTVFTGPASASVSFDVSVGANANISGEWGYGNGGSTGFGSNVNFFSSMAAGATAFAAAPNLDGAAGLNGPNGGLTAGIIPLGGLGAIDDEVIATLTLSAAIMNLSFLDDGVIFEFGSDAAFITGVIPAPGALALLALAAVTLHPRRRRGARLRAS